MDGCAASFFIGERRNPRILNVILPLLHPNSSHSSFLFLPWRLYPRLLPPTHKDDGRHCLSPGPREKPVSHQAKVMRMLQPPSDCPACFCLLRKDFLSFQKQTAHKPVFLVCLSSSLPTPKTTKLVPLDPLCVPVLT